MPIICPTHILGDAVQFTKPNTIKASYNTPECYISNKAVDPLVTLCVFRSKFLLGYDLATITVNEHEACCGAAGVNVSTKLGARWHRFISRLAERRTG